MLIQFSVGNYASFKDVVTLSMVASSGKELENQNVFKVDNLRLLRSTLILGPNASGKSNLINALSFLKFFVLESSKEGQVGKKIEVDSFKLSSETENKPSIFEIIFIYENVKYRYGFEADNTKVLKEWLFHSPKGRETMLFERNLKRYSLGVSFRKEGKDVIEKTRENALFLSAVAQWNGPIAEKVLKGIDDIRIISGFDDMGYIGFSQRQLKDIKYKNQMVQFIKIADLGIEDLSVVEEKHDFTTMDYPENMPEPIKDFFKQQKEATIPSVKMVHKKYDEENNFVSFEKFNIDDESEGTKKIFALSAPLIDTLENGYTLVVDELDARLHPTLTRFLTGLFTSSKTNKNNAQLIFIAHDSSLMKKNFRRDQIWFTRKDRYGCSDLYSLFEYKVRKDASFEKDYSLGKYGAVPMLGDPEELFGEI